jgi:hypothetical protein
MKKLVSDVQEASGANYQLWAEVTRCQTPSNLVCLTFSSVWTGAKNPEAPQNKGQFFLDVNDVESLIDMLMDAKNL